MGKDATEKAKQEAKPNAAGEKAKEKTPRAPAFPPEHKITFLKDKDGKPYDAGENNPKRAGSASHARFALYKSGMTVKDALEAGVTSADLKWDTSKNFIKIAA